MCQHTHADREMRMERPGEPTAGRVEESAAAPCGSPGRRGGCVIGHQHGVNLCQPPQYHDASCFSLKTEISCNLTFQKGGTFVANCVHEA